MKIIINCFFVLIIFILGCKNKPVPNSKTRNSSTTETKNDSIVQKPLIEIINPNATKKDRLNELENLPTDGTYKRVRYLGSGQEAEVIEMVFLNKKPIAYMYIFTKDGKIHKEALDDRQPASGIWYSAEHFEIRGKADTLIVNRVGEEYFRGTIELLAKD